MISGFILNVIILLLVKFFLISRLVRKIMIQKFVNWTQLNENL